MTKLSSKQKVVLFDIDYTLFDSDRFRDKLYKAILHISNHHDSTTLANMYSDVVDEYGYFNPHVFFDRVTEKLPIQDANRLRIAIWAKANFENNFYKETQDVIAGLSHNMKIGIFSKGDDAWQRAKISTIKHLFDKQHIHITIDKHTTLPSIIARYKLKKLYLVDDALVVLHTAKRLRKNVFTIWVKRGRYAEVQKPISGFEPDAEVKNLRGIANIIKGRY